VIQFPQSAFPEFDDLVRYEDMLIDVLSDTHDVDGHDFGSGEVNFFVLTGDPDAALDAIRGASDGSLLAHPQARVGARRMDGEDYEIVWPDGDQREFNIV
jgi:hypothetical protein